MKKKVLLIMLVLFVISIVISCDSNSSSSSNSTSINGTYRFKDSSVKLKVTISGSSWSGETTILSGTGYDDSEYNSGIVKGKDLYDSSGFVKIGYVIGKSLHTSIANQRVTLKK